MTSLIYAPGPMSGAHFNPAVTFGLWPAGRFSAGLMPAYLIGMLAEATSASASLAPFERSCPAPLLWE